MMYFSFVSLVRSHYYHYFSLYLKAKTFVYLSLVHVCGDGAACGCNSDDSSNWSLAGPGRPGHVRSSNEFNNKML